MILVINTGSSSLKAKLFSSDFAVAREFHYKGLKSIGEYTKAVKAIKQGVASSLQTPEYTAHRIVMGGKGAKNGEVVDEVVMRRLKKYSYLAPLHNPQAIAVIRSCQQAFDRALNVAAYDSAFFDKLPEEEYTLPIDKNISARFDLRKYGFHGFSHQVMADNFSKRYQKLITIHLGAGCSISAIDHGVPVATSMGLTPQGGLMMERRCGDIDPGLILFLTKRLGLKKTETIINANSGLKGVSGTSGSMLEILHLSGNPVVDADFSYKGPNNQHLRHQAALALEMFCQRVRDFIGAYSARMGGVEALAFSGRIGHGSKFIRDKITYGLDYLNLREVASMEADEELTIAAIVRNKYYQT